MPDTIALSWHQGGPVYSRHDHTGHMEYHPDGSCWCTECGQQWEILTIPGRPPQLRAVPYEGSHPAGNARRPR